MSLSAVGGRVDPPGSVGGCVDGRDGVPIAITTAGSTVFLLACQLTFFTAMGTLIILTVAYSLGYSLLFFMPLLRVAGPEGRVGDICHFLRGLKCACCRKRA